MSDDTTFKHSWFAMSETKLRKYLEEQKYPAPIIRDALNAHRSAKAKAKAEKTRTTVLYRTWDDVLRPARTELGTVRTMKTQLTRIMADPMNFTDVRPKYTALCAYEEVLVKVIAELRVHQKNDDYTPQALARALKDAGKRDLAHSGTHWTAYVERKDRVRVMQLFEQVPDPVRGKRKVPFELRISPEEFDRNRAVLVGQINKAETEVQQQLTLLERRKDAPPLPEDEEARRQAKIKELEDALQDLQFAYYQLDILPRTTRLPTTWRGLLDFPR